MFAAKLPTAALNTTGIPIDSALVLVQVIRLVVIAVPVTSARLPTVNMLELVVAATIGSGCD